MKSIKIKIPEPCHEDWQKMTRKEQGRFCDSCEKVVYDMSKLTDNEIVKLIQSGNDICGRFRNDQLDRKMYASIPYKSKKSSWAIAASLLVGITFLASCEQVPGSVVGELEAVETVDSIPKCDTSSNNNSEFEEDVVGKIAVDNKDVTPDMPVIDPVEEELLHTAGVPVFIDEEEVDSL